MLMSIPIMTYMACPRAELAMKDFTLPKHFLYGVEKAIVHLPINPIVNCHPYIDG